MFRNLKGQPATCVALWLAYGLAIAMIAAAVYMRSEWMAACGIVLSLSLFPSAITAGIKTFSQ